MLDFIQNCAWFQTRNKSADICARCCGRCYVIELQPYRIIESQRRAYETDIPKFMRVVAPAPQQFKTARRDAGIILAAAAVTGNCVSIAAVDVV